MEEILNLCYTYYLLFICRVSIDIYDIIICNTKYFTRNLIRSLAAMTIKKEIINSSYIYVVTSPKTKSVSNRIIKFKRLALKNVTVVKSDRYTKRW